MIERNLTEQINRVAISRVFAVLFPQHLDGFINFPLTLQLKHLRYRISLGLPDVRRRLFSFRQYHFFHHRQQIRAAPFLKGDFKGAFKTILCGPAIDVIKIERESLKVNAVHIGRVLKSRGMRVARG